MISKRVIFIILFLLTVLFCSTSLPQVYNPFNQRDDQYRLLGLKRAKESFEVARAEYDRQKKLFEKELITKVDLERARGSFADAEVNYQQSLLAVLFEEQFVSVQAAVKYHADDGTRHVRLTLANASGGSEEFRKVLNIDDDLFKSLQPDIVHNTYVSLLNDSNAIISQPYEAKITELRYGYPQTIDFKLLQDLDAVTVFIIYGNGNQRSMKILLQKDSSVNKVEIQSEQFSQEVVLGKIANYGLTLELFSGVENTFTLEVVNLPTDISHYFSNVDGNVRLRQVKFNESSRTKNAILRITLPDRASKQVKMDESIIFYALAIPDNKRADLSNKADHHWTEGELAELDIGYVKLELIPRGKGELIVHAPQLYHSILPDEVVEIALDLVNEGSRRLDHIEIKADPPLYWDKEIIPQNISTLEIGEETKVRLRFTPPPNTSIGKYEIRIQTSGLSSGLTVLGSDKIATVEIRSKTNIIGTVFIVLFILIIVGGIVFYGIRLSRK
ncbi:MAG: hypothetical protein GY855_09530 [candidate division Zixibacteria bacterium]|nr:hypothetical protein [candidate division Zixibacteria bacterium]